FGPKGLEEKLRTSLFDRVSHRIFTRVHGSLERLDVSYARALERGMSDQKKLFAGVGLAFLASLVLAASLGAGFVPRIAAGELKISCRAPTGTRVEQSEKIAEELERIVREEIPAYDLRTILTSIGAPKRGLRAMLASNSGSHAGKIRVEL